MTDAELWNELRRVRDKVHRLEALEATVGGQGRLIAATRRELRDLVERVDNMSEAEKIANAVTSALSNERRAYFNGWRRLGAGLAAAILLVPALHDAASWLF